MNEKDILKEVKELDNYISNKNIIKIREKVLKALDEGDERYAKIIYQYASLFRPEIPEIVDLEKRLLDII